MSNWVVGEVLASVNDGADPPPADALAELADLDADGTISRSQAKEVFGELRDGKQPKQIVDERGLAQVSDESELAAVVDKVVADNAATIEEWRAGDDKVKKKKRGFLMGEAMKALKGQGNPQLLNKLLDDRLT